MNVPTLILRNLESKERKREFGRMKNQILFDPTNTTHLFSGCVNTLTSNP